MWWLWPRRWKICVKLVLGHVFFFNFRLNFRCHTHTFNLYTVPFDVKPISMLCFEMRNKKFVTLPVNMSFRCFFLELNTFVHADVFADKWGCRIEMLVRENVTRLPNARSDRLDCRATDWIFHARLAGPMDMAATDCKARKEGVRLRFCRHFKYLNHRSVPVFWIRN